MNKSLLLAFIIICCSLSAEAGAMTFVKLCDGCTISQKQALLRDPSTPRPGWVYIGDRTTGQLQKYRVESMVSMYFVAPEMPSDAMAMEFMAYSDAYKEVGNSLLISLAAAVPSSSSSVPASAFDITRDGAARQSVIEWLSDTRNWGSWMDAASFYAKLTIAHGRSLYTGADFRIRVDAAFSDGSTAVFNYDSSSQSLVFVEARDSMGNLIATSSTEPVPVDYSSYEDPDAKNQPDYDRGIDFLREHGVIASGGGGGGGSIQVYIGTVLVGDVIVVKDK